MTLKLVVNNPAPPEPTGLGVQGHEWKCPCCGCQVLKGAIAGARVRKGELNLNADSCHISTEIHCAGCDRLAAIQVGEAWKILN
jgi:hypothetical protein